MNITCLTLSTDNLLRLSDNIWPVFEKSLSQGTDVDTVTNFWRTILDKFGKLCLLIFHQTKGSLLRFKRGSSRNLWISNIALERLFPPTGLNKEACLSKSLQIENSSGKTSVCCWDWETGTVVCWLWLFIKLVNKFVTKVFAFSLTFSLEKPMFLNLRSKK